MALGHNSQAVHRAYARNAQVTLPPLEEYEREREQKVVPFEALQATLHVEKEVTPLAGQASAG